MILIAGGTTEGRAAVRVAGEGNAPYYYSTKGEGQEIECKNGIRLTGGMDATQMERFCREKEIRLLIDAAHPFAEMLHKTMAEVAEKLNLPVVRYERRYPPRAENIIWCENYDDAIRQLKKYGIRKLLALTGVQTIGKLRGYWENHCCWFRILNRTESAESARKQGFPAERLIVCDPEETNDTAALIRHLQPEAILTKESGETGYFNEKTEAAANASLPVFAIKRPGLPDTFLNVYGENELRRIIRHYLPRFFPLRSGYTTGTCATVAAKAALTALLTGKEQQTGTVTLPGGEEVTLPVSQTVISDGSAACTVIKDAGDDPDVTDGCAVVATVRIVERKEDSLPKVIFRGGEGVGTVTLPGLGLNIGEPAINPTPRRMIEKELAFFDRSGFMPEVTISVPGGKELAQRTFNPKLGIIDGISIIGTSGIVRPFSSEAFIASIRKEIEVASANHVPRLVINSGAKSEKYIKARYPDLSPQAFVHYGNFIGETLKIAAAFCLPEVTLGIMLGKAVKLAEGFLNTHSKKVTMNKVFLKELALQAGCTSESQAVIDKVTLARELWKELPEEDRPKFFAALVARCYKHCRPLFPDGKLTVLLIDEEGTIQASC